MQEREDICCNICQEEYNLGTKVPRSLNCGHTFCTSCLAECFQRGNFKCPTDRSEITVVAVELLPRNFSLIEIIVKASNRLYCPVHKKLLEFVCLNDSKLLCSYCLLYDHHTWHELAIFDEYVKELKNHSEQLSCMVGKLKGIALNQVKNVHVSKQYETEEGVKLFFKGIRKRLDQMELNILSEINREFERAKLSTVREEVVNHWINKAEYTLEAIRNAGEGGVYVLSTEEKGLIESGNAILNDPEYLKSSSELDQIYFTTNEAALNSLISLNIAGQHSTSPLNVDVTLLSIDALDTLCSFCGINPTQGFLCSNRCNLCLFKAAKKEFCVECKQAMRKSYWESIKNSKTFNCRLCNNKECLANASNFDCDCLFCANCTKSIREQFRSNGNMLRCICGIHLTSSKVGAADATANT